MMIASEESFTARFVGRKHVPTTRIFFDGTFLPGASTSNVVSATSSRSSLMLLRPPSRSTLAVAVICGAAVGVMLGSSSQIQMSTVRQLHTGITRAIGPAALVRQAADGASSTPVDEDDGSQLVNATENNGGNYFLDLFLEALIIDDTSVLTKGKDSTDFTVEIVFEESLNMTTATTVSSGALSNSTGNSEVTGEIGIIVVSNMEEQGSDTDETYVGLETSRTSSGPDPGAPVKLTEEVLKPEEKPVKMHVRRR